MGRKLKKNKSIIKGFTLIEIITVVVIIGIFALLVIPSFSNILQKFRKDYYKDLESNVVESTKDFFVDNRVYRPTGLLETTVVNLNTLVSKGFIDDVVDYDGKECPDSYALAIKSDLNSYEYVACITCENGKYLNTNSNYCDASWKTNDNLDTELNVGDTVYVYTNSSNEEIKEQVKVNLKVRKRDFNGDILKEIDVSDESILPENIDDLRSKSVGSTVLLRYNYENTVQTRTAIIYGHGVPKVVITDKNNNSYTGNWDNKITINISADESDSSYIKSGTTPKYYQYNYNGVWNTIDGCTGNTTGCTFNWNRNGIFNNITFRIINNKGFKSSISEGYNIKFDNIKPRITNVNPLEKDYYTTLDDLEVLASATITDNNDNGGSGVKTRKYRFDTNASSKEYTSYSVNSTYTGTVSNNLSSGIYYLWCEITDIAGNIATSMYGPYNVGYTITYDVDYGYPTPPNQLKKYDETIKITDVIPTKDGYEFVGWGINNTVIYNVGSNYSENASIRLKAIYTPEVYTVRYDSNTCVNATNMPNPDNFTVIYGKSVNLSNTEPICNNYNFLGWSTDKDATSGTYQKGDTYSERYDKTLYAIWRIKKIPYIVENCMEDINNFNNYVCTEVKGEVDYTTSPFNVSYFSTVNSEQLKMYQYKVSKVNGIVTTSVNLNTDINNPTKISMYYDLREWTVTLIDDGNFNSIGFSGTTGSNELTNVTYKDEFNITYSGIQRTYKYYELVSIKAELKSAFGYTYKWDKWFSYNTNVIDHLSYKGADFNMPVVPDGSKGLVLKATAIKQASNDTPYYVYRCLENVTTAGYTCSYQRQNAGTTDTTINISELIDAPNGYEYKRATIEEGGATITESPTILGDGSRKIYLYYDAKYYTLTLTPSNSNYVSVSGGGTYKYKSKIKINATLKSVANTQIKFLNWFFPLANSVISTNVAFDYTMPNYNVSLVANVEAVKIYKIEYVLNLESTTNNPNNISSYKNGDTFTFKDPTTTKCYSFEGWYTDKSLTNRKTTLTASDASDITLYAKWQNRASTRTLNTIKVEKKEVLKWSGYTYYEKNKEGVLVEMQKPVGHWCSASSTDEKDPKCVTDGIGITITNGVEYQEMYPVTCSLTGKTGYGKWCPLHAGTITSNPLGGSSKHICDASTKTYSPNADCPAKGTNWTCINRNGTKCS